MAPPFLSLGVDSDDEGKNILNNTTKPISIPTSIDSDDGNNEVVVVVFFLMKIIIFLFKDHSSVSLSDLPINPPPPDVDRNLPKIDENAPLSEPPSPFLSREIYLECHRNGIEQVNFNDFLRMFCFCNTYIF